MRAVVRGEDLLRALGSRKTGVVNRLQVFPEANGEQLVVRLAARIADLGILPSMGGISNIYKGHGSVSACLEDALFEVAERCSAACTDHRSLLLARPSEDGPFLFGRKLPLFADAQYDAPGFPFRRLTAASRIHWASGRSLVTGKTVQVPAPLVYVPYASTTEDEWLGPSTSTGMACHRSFARACLLGLLEVAERDAFAILWMNRLSMPRLEGSGFAAELDGGRGRVRFVDMTNDLRVPAVLAVLETSHEGRSLVTVGLAARPTFADAARKALFEAAYEAERQRELLHDLTPFAPTPDFSNVIDWEHHSLVYLDPERQADLAFLTDSPMAGTPPASREVQGSDEELLAQMVHRVAASGDVIVVSLTTREFAELGLHAVKVFAPGAVPLNSDHRYPWLGVPRLFQSPCTSGLRVVPLHASDLNRLPHPFA